MRTSFTLNAHTDVRLVADCLKIFRQKGTDIQQPDTYSKLVRLMMESFRASLMDKKQFIADSADAMDYLDSQGFSTKQRGHKKGALITDITLDSVEKEITLNTTEHKEASADFLEGIRDDNE